MVEAAAGAALACWPESAFVVLMVIIVCFFTAEECCLCLELVVVGSVT